MANVDLMFYSGLLCVLWCVCARRFDFTFPASLGMPHILTRLDQPDFEIETAL